MQPLRIDQQRSPSGAEARAEPGPRAQAAIAEIELLVRARYPILYVLSAEEDRVVGAVRESASRRDKRLLEWSFTTGLVDRAPGSGRRGQAERSRDPLNALDEVISMVEPAIYLFKDLHPFLGRQNFAVVRKLREVAMALKDSHKTLILLAPVLELPPDLDKHVTVIDFPLPEAADMDALLGGIIDEVAGRPEVTVELDAGGREQLTRAALGLTLDEAENVFAKILVGDRRLDGSDIDAVFAEKRQIIRRNGLLDYLEPEIGLDQVGGLDRLKGWLRQRTEAHTARAREFGLPPPRGLFLLGVQGCGKSLCARAVASEWRMPLLRLDFGRLFGSLVGSSEENIRRALAVAESIAPVVLWVDEIDKALAGAAGSGGSDGGTTARVLGTFLTWMSERTAPVFVVATANSVAELPPELVRKGRFDEIFFVDLPTRDERREIFDIQVRGRGRDPEAFDLPALAAAADGFSGAIEEVVIAALYDAFDRGVELDSASVLGAVAETVPLVRTMETELGRLREWAEGRARWATSREVAATPGRRRLDL